MSDMPERAKLMRCRVASLPTVEHYVLVEDDSGTEYVRADLALPRPWSAAEDLEALPVGSVVRDKVGNALLKGNAHSGDESDPDVWFPAGADYAISAAQVAWHSPGLILYTPSAA
jgi:hypothetical protein